MDHIKKKWEKAIALGSNSVIEILVYSINIKIMRFRD